MRFKVGDKVVIPTCNNRIITIKELRGDSQAGHNCYLGSDSLVYMDEELEPMTDKEVLNHKITELEKAEKELQKQIAALREEVNKPAKLEDGCYITKFNVGNIKDRDRVAFIDGNSIRIFSLDGAMQLNCSSNNTDLTKNYEGFVKISSLDPLRK